MGVWGKGTRAGSQGRTMRALLLTSLLAAALAAGCGADDSSTAGSGAGDKPKLETTDAGTRKIAVTDEKAGLRIEVQDDSLYVTPEDGAPQSTADLEGDLLGASCEDDGREGVQASPQFPVYWRDESKDWGSALAREDELGRVESYDSFDEYDDAEESRPVLAEHVTRCKLFATQPTGQPEEVVFDAQNDAPLATATFR